MQVSKATEADRIEKLGVSRTVGAVLVAAWLIVLVCTIVFRRRTDYESRKELHWWEAFYRTGSIIFGGGQVNLPCMPVEKKKDQRLVFGPEAQLTSDQIKGTI